tara:strand:+ start:31768 stop:33147 length:1380 start_codon:yes stop_codon:yes gene_type:complete
MIPEVAALHRTGSIVRIPPADDVPMSDRVRRVIDTAPMQRLSGISQLGMVALVYPGATHSRLEHSLGVYHNSLRLLARFADDPAFTALVDDRGADAFVLASLVHDVGHWPFCHPIEDIDLHGLPEHESRVAGWLDDEQLAACVDQDWQCDASDVLSLLEPTDSVTPPTHATQLLRSCLSGPIDVDKLDYLQRDSLHAGVPYGRNFDVGRLISSICVHPNQKQIAVGEKGRTAAEMMVFSRYVMFSEVYWHHTVRSATAMLQRAVFQLRDELDWDSSLRLTDNAWTQLLGRLAEGTPVRSIVEGLFGQTRQLYKRAAEFNVIEGGVTNRLACGGGAVHRMLARRPYWWLAALSQTLAERLSRKLGVTVAATDILVDAPPVKLEVDIDIDVIGADASVHTLGEVSPVASALANRQFDDQVKRVRVFVPAPLRRRLRDAMFDANAWSEELMDAATQLENEIV